MIKGLQPKEIELSCASINLLTGPNTLSAKATTVGDQIINPIRVNGKSTAEIAATRRYLRDVEAFLVSGIGINRSRMGVGLLWICRAGEVLTARSLAWNSVSYPG